MVGDDRRLLARTSAGASSAAFRPVARADHPQRRRRRLRLAEGRRSRAAVERVFATVMAPVRAIAGVGDRLSAIFGPMAVAIQAAAAKIAQNDCSPIREAAEKIEQTALKIITPIVECVQPIIAKVKTFLSAISGTRSARRSGSGSSSTRPTSGRPSRTIAAMIQAAAQWIWDKTATIRAVAERAWIWLKNKIGIGEGAEGQNGILQWVAAQARSGMGLAQGQARAVQARDHDHRRRRRWRSCWRSRRPDRSSRSAPRSPARCRGCDGLPRTGARATPSSRLGPTSRRHCFRS